MEVTIVTSTDLRTQTLVIEGRSQGRIPNPREPVEQQISDALRDANITSYSMEFDGVKVYPRSNSGYPNPTFSHYLLASYLKTRQTKALVDLGCGVGFLGNYGAVHLKPDLLIFSDLYGQALKQSQESYGLNNTPLTTGEMSVYGPDEMLGGDLWVAKYKTDDKVVEFRKGNSALTLKDFDGEGSISVCAPMFLPGVCHAFPEAYDFFASVAKNTGSRLLVGHSSLASDMVADAAIKHGLEMSVRAAMQAPFLIEYTTENRGAFDALKAKGLQIIDDKAFHTLTVSELYAK
jgi:hypothetical protein